MSIVIDLNLVCVICLQDGDLRSVFDHDDATALKISDKIMKCSNLSIDSKMPDKICNRCVEDLTAAYRFRQNCETANSVFRLIQQQEDELASFELEKQKIKIPTGLKIKRIQPDLKTYLMPMRHCADEVTVAPEKAESVAGSEEALERIAEDDTVETTPNADNDNEEHMEQVELDDYYEAEEVLDEQFEEEIVEIKVEAQANPVTATHIKISDSPQESSNDVVIKREFDEDEVIAEENTPPRAPYIPKRGRGRPKRSLQPPKMHQVLEYVEDDNADDLNEGAPKSRKTSVLKPIEAGRQRSRARKSMSPDSRPTKICDICGNGYKYQHALNAHMRRHNNDRPFSCEFCEKAFVSAVELRRHMRVHTGHKPYACQYCERRFSDFGSRIKHERTHTGERPYSCSTCGKAFAYAHVLTVHLRTHTGEKKFKCSHCGKGFTKKTYLEAHLEQHARAAVAEADAEADESGMFTIKQVALEECILRTEYIDEVNDDDDYPEDDDEVEQASVAAEEVHMAEEHLEDHDVDDTEPHNSAVFPHIIKVSMKQDKIVLDSDDSNYESVLS